MLSNNDRNLLSAIQGGAAMRNAALQLLFGEPSLRHIVINYARTNGGNTEDGKDLFQDAVVVFERCVREGKFNGRCSLRTYFVSIAKWHWANLRRKKANQHEPLPNSEILGWTDGPESDLLQNEQRVVLQQALEGLGERNSKLLGLYKLAYSMDEIAREMGLSSAEMAKKEVHRSRERLRTFLQRHPEMMEALLC